MAYTVSLQMLMNNLKKLIHGNHHPLINNNPMILSQRPRFQLLYQELASIIQTLCDIQEDHHDNPDELEKVRNLKKRFKDAVEEAQDTIDLFLSALHFTNSRVSPRSDVIKTSLNLFLSALHFRNRQLYPRSDVLKTSLDLFLSALHFTQTSLDLNKILKSIKSVKVELKTINLDNMKLGSSSGLNHVKTQSVAAGTSYTRNPLGVKKLSEEIVVGFDLDAEIIRDKLTEDTKQLGVVSIVGMGGLGKTTLATKVFNDRFVVYHFHVRAWVTVSQSYKRRDLLIQILTSIGVQQDLEKDNDSKLREKLHKKLMGRRYLIVIDDIWSIEAWDDFKLFLPHENTGSRILLTSRLNEVALHAKPHGFVHSLPCLTQEKSWELLKQKVFHGVECPEWLIKPGMNIAKKCQGLPLSVVVMAGVLAEKPMSKDLWEKLACNISSSIVNNHKENLETLALSYHHLPDHLRECFLYLGGFPEDFGFAVKRLIWLWVAEGFIEEDRNRSLEDSAKAYLMDLINRNLVIVAKRDVNGDVKSCKLHDLVRELCLKKAKEERLFLKMDSPPLYSQLCPGILQKQRRVFTNEDILCEQLRLVTHNFTHFPTRTMRSILCFYTHRHMNMNSIKSIARCFVLLRVLDLQHCMLDDLPQEFASLVHLRYLAIWYSSEFPKSICKLWSLQTLILQTNFSWSMHLPSDIQQLVNLRHLWSDTMFYLPCNGKPTNLHSISEVVLKDGIDNLQKCFPIIKKLALRCVKDDNYHFELLPYLETLKLMGSGLQHNHISFPATLRKLTLVSCFLPWSAMSIIHLLPNLEVLKLRSNAFIGTHWDACEQQFRQLKLLTLESLNIRHWEASTRCFPCLKRLSVFRCSLEKIPLEIGDTGTLELIEIGGMSYLVKSVKRIQQEQHDLGNYDLKITVDEMELSFYLSQHEGSDSE